MTFVSTSRLRAPQDRRATEPDGSRAAVELRIVGMHCAACVSRVEQALGSVPGVGEATVNLASDRARVRLVEPVEPEALVRAVRAAGYEARPVSGAGEDEAERHERAAAIATLERRLWAAVVIGLPA